MPIFLLIRHGENDYVRAGKLPGRVAGIHLNERGQAQAAALGDSLKDAPLAAIYSSPLERALETAAPIAAGRGLEIESLPGLMDTDVGQWQAAELKQLSKLPEWKTVQQAPSRFTFPGGESFLACQARMVAVFESLAQKHADDELLAVVFHADPVKLVLAYYLGMPLDTFQRLGCDTASLSILRLAKGGAQVGGMNLKPPFALPLPEKKGRKK
ncbi:MAG: histidine phosphatase family protein [Anaerolineales bacterium]|jgi:probable phosphoglycerate mutase|nr:histidine phosphatase family protein [Anaerolineales bacterium]